MGKIIMQSLSKKPTLILLHGWGLSKETWNNIVPELSKQYTIYMLDLLGFGDNQQKYHVFILEDYIKQIDDFLEKNNIKNCILLGHSFGGTLAICYALQFPQKIQKLIIYSSGSPFKNTANGITYSLRKFFGRHFVLLFSIIMRGIKNKKLTVKDIQQLTRTYYGIKARTDSIEILQKIKQPILIIGGRFDPLSPESFQKRLLKHFSNARLVIFNRSTHGAHVEEKEKFVETVKAFIDEK